MKKDWLHTWLWEYKKQTLRHSTFKDYLCYIERHINSAIGHYKLKDLRLEYLQALYNTKYQEGLS
ncbi:N-terminal phage integrase SAM-like domain-containing protein [Caldicellulosiruptor obsidiansis]|uniref:N-terminal phage integrase SAM-like domain-containing protein n=1 Tax=Caldicellulosiruptor obsidiansis TaxID=717609 RepID=UPI00030D08F8|nr:N-terminal phage integrase SAM-like domain-containing protein [Caldicellulosiruptor obsidiansis]